MKKTATAVRPIVLSTSTIKALCAWARPLGLSPKREDEWLAYEVRSACIAQTTSFEAREAFSDFVEPPITAPKLMHGTDYAGQDLSGWYISEKP